MLCTDSLEHVAVSRPLKASQWIRTKDIYIVSIGDFIPELFQPNSRFSIPNCPKRRLTFSADGDTGMLSLRGIGSDLNEIVGCLQESSRIRAAAVAQS
jgi:hypothetical protein